jgi:hypothetical protein
MVGADEQAAYPVRKLGWGFSPHPHYPSTLLMMVSGVEQ